MKPVFLLFVMFLFICSCVDSITTISESKEERNERIIIDTIIIPEKKFKNCFKIEKSEYPQIKGFKNKEFEFNMNLKIKNFVMNFIDTCKKQTECERELNTDIPMGWATIRFEILQISKNLVTLVIFKSCGFGGGNSWIPASKTFNIDILNSKELRNDFVNEKELPFEFINQKIKNYLEKIIIKSHADEELNIGKVTKQTKYEDMEFSIRNDTLLLFSVQYPTCHATYSVYDIPIINLKNSGLKSGYNYLLSKE